MKHDLVVGMKLYAEKIFRNAPPEIVEYTISKIGRKYFEVDGHNWYQFQIDTLYYVDKNYSQNNKQLYRSRKEIEEKNEWATLHSNIRNFFSYSSTKLTLEQLRKIEDIIKENNS